MKMMLVKVPFGPEFTLYEGEFYAATRHRLMLLFYLGIAAMILFTSTGRTYTILKPELMLGIAALEVLVGVFVVVLCKAVIAWRARLTGRIPRTHIGWILVATVTTAAALSEVLNPYILGVTASGPLHFALKLVFYLTVTELMTGVMLQYCLGYILADLRKGKPVAEGNAQAADLRDATA